MSSLFDLEEVPAETTGWVLAQVGLGRGGWIYGAMGSGKSHAVRAADLRGPTIRVAGGALLGQRFAVDLARQLGTDGRVLLEAARREGFAAALEVAERVVNGRPLVVEAAEQLLGEAINLDEPATALWQEDKNALRGWLIGRLEHTPTFLLSRRKPGDQPLVYVHRPPERLFVRLGHETSGGLPTWERLQKLARNNPGAFAIARGLVGLVPASAFLGLLEEVAEDEADLTTLFQRFGQAFQSSAPASWQRVLSLVSVLGDVPRDAVEFVLGSAADETGQREPTPDDALGALHGLWQLGLVEERDGRLSVLPALSAHGVRPLTDRERSELLPKIAHHLLAPINNVRDLEPKQADRVLLAHSIFVMLGDLGSAERTAVLHVHGLVDLARRSSLNERFSSAWQQYDSVLRMLSASEFALGDRAGQRLFSYVRHYRAWNGSRAGALDDASCLDEYGHAIEVWPENALWHQRFIQTLVELGRLVEARRAVERGYSCVDDHPRRDELLRVRPAWTALEARALQFSLELIEPTLHASPDLFPQVVRARDALLKRWEHGLQCDELTFRRADSEVDGRVKLLQAAELRVRRSASGWVAEMQSLWTEASAESPGKALEALARSLGEEARRLISTITPDLSDQDIRRKGVLLSYVDALNSDVGLRHDPDRWIVGRIEGPKLIPTMRRLPAVEIPPELMPEEADGLYFVRVPVYRDGFPSGPAEVVKPAGRGFGYADLVEVLDRMNENAS